MRIEVIIGSEESLSYPLKGNKITIGSGESSGIVIPSSAGISRKHADIIIDGDKVFISDLGSTNGTFINEERIVPGSKKEFTSFFPVRLADHVYLSLITDDEDGGNQFISTLQQSVQTPAPKKDSTSNKTTTTTLTLMSKGNGGTSTSIKAKIEQREQGKQQKGKSTSQKAVKKGTSDSTRMRSTIGLVVLLIAAAGVYKFYLTPQEVANVLAPPVDQQAAGTKPPEEVLPDRLKPVSLPETADIPGMDELQKAFGEVKCATTMEKSLCEVIPEMTFSYSGAVGSVGKVIILIDEIKWYKESLKGIADVALDFKIRTDLVFLAFIQNFKNYKWAELDKNVFVVFYRPVEGSPKIFSVVGAKSSQLDILVKSMPADLISQLNLQGTKGLEDFTKRHTIVKPTSEYKEEVAPAPVESQPVAQQTVQPAQVIQQAVPPPPQISAPPPAPVRMAPPPAGTRGLPADDRAKVNAHERASRESRDSGPTPPPTPNIEEEDGKNRK